MKKDGIKSWEDLYVLLRESYESNKLFDENFRCCKEDFIMEENKTICGCKSEKKDYCIIFTIGEKDERHVIIRARDAQEAVEIFRQFRRILFALCSYPNPTDVMIIRVFETEV